MNRRHPDRCHRKEVLGVDQGAPGMASTEKAACRALLILGMCLLSQHGGVHRLHWSQGTLVLSTWAPVRLWSLGNLYPCAHHHYRKVSCTSNVLQSPEALCATQPPSHIHHQLSILRPILFCIDSMITGIITNSQTMFSPWRKSCFTC